MGSDTRQPPDDSGAQEPVRKLEQLEQELRQLREAQAGQQSRSRQLLQLLDLCEHERKLFAHEIHDGIVQDLTGSLLFLDASLHRIEQARQSRDWGRQEGVEDDLRKTSQLLRKSIAESRRLMSGLKPPLLQENGLGPAIGRLVDDLRSTYDMRIELRCDLPDVRLLPSLEIGLFRIIQESLHNVRRHSGTLAARVTAVLKDDTITATVADRGVGFEPSELTEGGRGFGLAGIRERVELAGGEVAIESEPGTGTTVTVRFPAVYE